MSPVPVTVMVGAVVFGAVLAFVGDRRFFLADDTAGAWLPVSRRIGELLRSGDSHLMDPDLWRGGNFVASARYGVWNPVALAFDVTVLQLDDLAVVALLVSSLYLVALAVGCYLLAREYGAAPWPSALAGLVAATGGWTLWLDAAWWTPHLASLAFTPFVWLAARRVMRGVGSPIWFVVAALLCVTVGNPYSNVVVFVAVVAVVAEFGDRSRPGPVVALGASLVAVALVAVFVYLPFQQTSGVGFRETGLFNDERWSPGAGDLLRMSTPTARPYIGLFGAGFLGFPAMYLSWFVLPLLPWVRWTSIARRRVVGLAVFAGTFLVLALGPSNAWFFRWPLRLLPYVYLPVVIGASVVLSGGLLTERWRRRAAASTGIVIAGTYLAWADVPNEWRWHLVGAVAVLGSVGLAVVAGRRSQATLVVTLMAATLVMLALQLQWKPVNASVSEYAMPTRATDFEENIGRYEGTVMQVGSVGAVAPGDRAVDRAYRDLTFGSTAAVAGVAAVATYSALGFAAHDDALCVRFDGRTCAEAWDRLWAPAGSPLDGATGTGQPMVVDALGVDTVVVQRSLIDTADSAAPPGWRQSETTDYVVVWERLEGRAWPDGRLTNVAGQVSVTSNVAQRPHLESVEFRRVGEGDAQLTFARLAWPGYEATIDGRPLLVGGDAAGLLTVSIPADVGDGEVVLTWVPPYWRPSLVVLALGLLVAIVTQVLWWRHRRPDRVTDPRD